MDICFRAEKSRCAAKYRRDRESEELANLTELLPFDPEVVKNLDKASILRLATCYLQMKQITKQGKFYIYMQCHYSYLKPVCLFVLYYTLYVM